MTVPTVDSSWYVFLPIVFAGIVAWAVALLLALDGLRCLARRAGGR